eukprot:s6561_g3.t1
MGNSWILKDKRVMPTDNTELAESATMKGIKLQKIQDYGILLPHDLKDGTPMSFQQGRITAAVRRLGRLKNCAAACCKQGLCDDLCDLLKKGSSAKQKAGFTPHRIIQVITMNSAGAACRADVHFLETVFRMSREQAAQLQGLRAMLHLLFRLFCSDAKRYAELVKEGEVGSTILSVVEKIIRAESNVDSVPKSMVKTSVGRPKKGQLKEVSGATAQRRSPGGRALLPG